MLIEVFKIQLAISELTKSQKLLQFSLLLLARLIDRLLLHTFYVSILVRYLRVVIRNDTIKILHLLDINKHFRHAKHY